MCDSIVVNKSLCRNGRTIFGKASDRGVNEPQPLVYVPAADHAPGTMVKCTYIEAEQAPHTYATILAKPSWIWGAEIGVNEHGLCIGNEAVISREMNVDEQALLGMDVLRMALERAVTAREAVEVIGALMERYGQGGNASFDGTFHYDNAYLVVDENEMWHVETAGKHLWAAKQVHGGYSISNFLTLDHPELMHPDLIKNAEEKGYETEEPFHFAKTYINWANGLNPSGMLRRACSFPLANREDFTEKDMVEILRSHYAEDAWTKGENCVCMHAAPGPLECQTTCAMVAECKGKDTVIWGTGMSTTCIAPFQPCWFDAYSKKQVFDYDNMEAGVAEWVKREGINRAILAGKICEEEYKKELYAMENKWFAQVETVALDRASRQALCDAIADEAEAFIDKWLESAAQTSGEPKGSEEFQSWWNKKTEALGTDKRLAR